MIPNFSRAVLLFFLPILVAGCSTTPTAQTDFDPYFDFSGAQAIAILPIDRQVSSVASISDMQADRLEQSLADELTRLGYEVVRNSTDAHMLLTWHLVTQERTQVRTYNSMSARYTSCWQCGPTSSNNVRVTQYTQGTLIVDLIDQERMRSVWRSIVESRMRDMSDPDQAAEIRRAVAEAIFAEFPPG